MKTYIVRNKEDDYNNCRVEIVKTTQKNAKEYYFHKEVEENDIEVLKKYIDYVEYDEEKERNSENRFY